jgi:hypothetical protein
VRTSTMVLAILMLVLLFAADSTSVRASSDVTIKTRRNFGGEPNAVVETNTVYLKGTRQRRDELLEWPTRSHESHLSSRISLCDEHRMLMLNGDKRTYAYEPIVDYHATLAARVASAALSREPSVQAGAVVTVTFDAVDTGERRQVGRYTARHVISTRKTEPSPGAQAPPALEERDGWYVDLPSTDCSEHDSQSQTQAMLTISDPGRPADRYEFKQLRSAKRGYPIEEIGRSTQNGAQVMADRIELIEIAETPLDDALFTVPEGYRPALPRALGGYDYTRPDTFINRLESYGEAINYWWNSWWNRDQRY